MRLTVRLTVLAAALFGYVSVCQIANAQTPTPTPVQAGQALISELRWRGPAGAEDEFVEIYNNTNNPMVVQSLDGSSGWSVVISNGSITGPVCTIANGTPIPTRGHLLCTNTNGYSLAGYPSGGGTQTTGDRTWDFDVPDGAGVALFASTNGTNLNATTRLDAFGFINSPALFKEGAGFPTVPNANTEHTLFRDQRPSLTPKDTNDNAADFLFVQDAANIQNDKLGAPGPENLNSPTLLNTLGQTLLDTSVPASSPPNRVRTFTPETNANNGSLYFRRTFTNNTGQNLVQLRFRVYDMTTRGFCSAPCADIRLLTSFDQDVTLSNGTTVVQVQGVTLEENPPSQPAGGGFNATVSDNDINFNTPLPPGATVSIQFKFGLVRSGNFRFGLNIEGKTQVNNP